ncbi:3',5'-cyclic adenosine monophosphate phosphodiesterase CpdA [Bacterioplanes sanyensis]|uniref:3',5'-cyclic-AMP phosphodiesterase n=1 Tax=Bacterioplanes sanyensis TaxID=1249553 RepID=UPI00199C1AD0|nr:3',5'-cyclic-AMP phosphodiesterase [Bacterioplanes sanyensis]GGY50622.1 3',5'-cyclic adenosine monophosphate phosphodiesterase CpdA [Bacterioplanes sanyensis]
MYTLQQSGSLRLVQITDTHLNEPEDGHLLGMQTLHSLRCVLDTVRQEQQDIDAILVTGDLSQDGSERSYQHLRTALDGFSAPSFWLAGNHDERAAMQRADIPGDHLTRVIRAPHWQIILINSQVPGKVFGRISQAELDFLEQTLSERPDLHTLVTFHHHPVDMGSRWIDKIGIRNAEQLLDVIDRHNNVRCLLWGHVHQESDQMRNGVRLLSTPSTCVQFEPGSEDFSVDTRAPGYRWLELHADGRLDTGVSRVEGIHFEVDYSVKGY